ncbi:hypothetical protein ER308_16375 [Egibacter rhizosphaerae]|uniref:Nucleoside phosphorylase domain-containing protein n=1 Tax=Egibacter rhizosphaerae TaxID=1670831 RepID=A0A411YI47_9ACTN|nr:hypothetical protein [Egibacter rhizosphaerae]QBI20995.1 hypothetical protein ER308_16375 [Egibacter rhizosphaerae]
MADPPREPSHPPELLLVTSSAAAATSVAQRLADPRPVETEGLAGERGDLAGADTAVHAVGLGRAAAAFALARLLRDPPTAVVACGGLLAYPDSGLEVGDVVSGTVDTYADLGAEREGDGLTDAAELGFRVAPGAPGQSFVCDPRVAEALRDAGADRDGPLLTSELATTTAATAATLRQRWGAALGESREGAAAAHACLLESVPFAQLRSVTAVAGDGATGRADAELPHRLLDVLATAVPTIRDTLDHPFS